MTATSTNLITADVTRGAIEWLWRHGYSVAVELGVGCHRSPREVRMRQDGRGPIVSGAEPTCPEAARRLDVVGVGDSGTLVGVEVKVSEADLVGDKKMRLYQRWVDRLYIAVPEGLAEVGKRVAASRKMGLLVVTRRVSDDYISAERVLKGTASKVGPGPRADLILAIALRAGDWAYCPRCARRPSQTVLKQAREAWAAGKAAEAAS